MDVADSGFRQTRPKDGPIAGLSRAKKLAHGLEVVNPVTNGLDDHQNRYAEQQPPRAPQPAPCQYANKNGDRIHFAGAAGQ